MRSLSADVNDLFRGVFKPPFEELSIIIVNAALLLGIWFLLNPSLVVRYPSLIFLPAAIASWAFADVPATNLFGADPQTALSKLDQPAALRRWFTAKNIVLWILISPACALLAFALMPSQDQPMLSIAVVVAVLTLPFAYLGVCSLVAPLLPFHKMPWRERLKRRDTWLRYGVGLVIPYVLTTPAALITLTPAVLIIRFVGQDPSHFLIAAILTTPWSFFLWRLLLRGTNKITAKRHNWLAVFLADPSRG